MTIQEQKELVESARQIRIENIARLQVELDGLNARYDQLEIGESHPGQAHINTKTERVARTLAQEIVATFDDMLCVPTGEQPDFWVPTIERVIDKYTRLAIERAAQRISNAGQMLPDTTIATIIKAEMGARLA